MDMLIRLDAYIDKDLLESDKRSHGFLEKLSNLMTVEEAIDYIFEAESADNVNTLYEMLGENDIAIISSNHFYDVYEKMKIMKDDIGLDLLLVDKVAAPVIDPENRAVRANIFDVINYMRNRTSKGNIVYFSVNPVWRMVMLYVLRKAFPVIKIILYIYDWLNLVCPYQHREVLQKFLNLPMAYIENEYRVLDLILKGDIVNGILHKDGGDDFHVLKDFPLPNLFFPAYLPKRLYQEPACEVRKPNTFVYLGRLYSPLEFVPELFSDAFIFDILDTISKQDFYIDLFYVRSPYATIRMYNDYFKDNKKIKMIEGKPLNCLLPDIAKKYHWGYLINNYRDDFSLIRQHVEAALPARIFTFMALGIPVVINEEIKFAADFIRQNQVGVVVAQKDIPDLSNALKRADYRTLQENVLSVRERLCLENNKNRFVEFLISSINATAVQP